MRLRSGWLAAVVVVMAVLTVVGCASMMANEQWTGRPIQEAVAKLGRPTSVIPGDGGATTYVWIVHRSIPVQNVTYDSQGNPMYSTAYRDSVRTLTFAVDAGGTIVTWNESDTHPSM